MLKRSFAEFHAQKAQPETLTALEKGYAALQRLQKQRFPESMFGTLKEDIVEYHKVTQVIDTLNKEIQVLVRIPSAFSHSNPLLLTQRSLSTGFIGPGFDSKGDFEGQLGTWWIAVSTELHWILLMYSRSCLCARSFPKQSDTLVASLYMIIRICETVLA